MYHGHPCRRCGETLRYIKTGRCADCQKRHYQDNRDRLLDYRRQYHQDNRERNHERKRRNRANNPESGKRYYQENRDRIRQQQTERRDPERERERGKQYYRTPQGRDKSFARSRKRRAVKQSVLSHPYTSEELQDRFALFDNACAYCGVTGELTIDHYKALSKGGHDLLWHIVPACDRCNKSKGDRELISWYVGQDFFSPHLFRKLLDNLPLDP